MKAEKHSPSQASPLISSSFIQEKARAILQIFSGASRQMYGTMTETRSTSLITMERLFITILTVTSFFLLLPLCSAVSFNFSSPSSVEANTEFSISLTAETSGSDTYDVKAFVNTDSKTSSEIYDPVKSSWQSPYYYVKSIFPSQREFKLKAYFVGETKICVRLRKTNSSASTEVCNPITVKPSTNSPSDGSTTSSPENNSKHLTPKNLSSQSSVLPNSSSSIQPAPSQPNELQDTGRIVLAPKSKIITTNPDIFVTKQEKTRLYIILAFTLLCITIIILLSLRLL